MSYQLNLMRLELCYPHLEGAMKDNPKDQAKLAAIVLADTAAIKQAHSGNLEPLKAYVDQVYEMEPEEVAKALSFFTQAYMRFKLAQLGFSREEAEKMPDLKTMTLHRLLASVSLEKSPELPEATK